MASPQVFDIDELSQPITPDRPCGHDLRGDASANSIYNRIKDARNDARRAERQAETGEDDAVAPNWRHVEELGLELLRDHSKDLQIVAWLLEALVRRHGFAGLRDGLRLADKLTASFWPDLYPIEEEDGVLDKIAPLIGLNGDGVDGTLVVPLRLTPLTDGTKSDSTFSYYHYEQAMSAVGLPDAADREQRKSDGFPSFDQLSAAGAASGKAFYRDLLDDIQAAQQDLGRLSDRVAEHCGEDMLPTSTLQGLLQDCLDAAKQIGGPVIALLEQPAGDDASTDTTNDGLTDGRPGQPGSSSADVANGAIRTREEAFRNLLLIAEYFRQAEPHSPVSYAIEKVVRWGRMELPELMEELIADENSRGHVFSLTGMRNDST